MDRDKQRLAPYYSDYVPSGDSESGRRAARILLALFGLFVALGVVRWALQLT